MAVESKRPRFQTRMARPAVVERLRAGLASGSVMLTAAAGFGKTTALEAALADGSTSSAWIRCAEEDRDAGRLLRRVLIGMRDVVPGAVDVLVERLTAAQEQVEASAVVREMLDDLDRLVIEPVVVVFDDAEWLYGSAAVTAVVEQLLVGSGAGVRVAVATRRSLALRLAKVRATGRLTELGPADLAFTAEECEVILRSTKGRPPTIAEVERVFRATEGWPLGVVLAARHAMGAAPGGADSRSRLADFVREEILDRLDSDLRDAVLDSSVVGQLDAASIDALRLPRDLPQRAAAAGLPIRPVEGNGSWAYHPLLRDLLRLHLERERGAKERRVLHARVAPALAAAGRHEEAVEHWLAAEAWPEAVAAIGGVAPGLLHTEPATVRRWLDALPDERRSAPSCLLLEGILAWEAGAQSDAVRTLRAAVNGYAAAGDVFGEWWARFALVDPLLLMGEWEEAVALADGFDREPALVAGILAPVVGAYAAEALGALGRVEESAALSRRVMEHPHLGVLRSVRPIWESEWLLLAGRFDELIAGADRAVSEFERFDPVNRLPLVSQVLATALTHQGRDAEARAMWTRVETFAQRAHMSQVISNTHAWRALLDTRAGDWRAAEEAIALAGAGEQGGWQGYVLHVVRARAAALRGDLAAAMNESAHAIDLMQRAPLSDRVLAVVDLAPALVEARAVARARALADEHLELCDRMLPGGLGRYVRSLLLGLRAWLRASAGEDDAAIADLRRMWEDAGPNAVDVVRREWSLLQPLLWRALEQDALDPTAVVDVIDTARPGGDALVRLTAHSRAAVRLAALGRAAGSGHPALPARLKALAEDREPAVAAAAAAAAARMHVRAPPLAFTLFGGFRVRRGGWEVADPEWDRRVAQRLVRYLIVHRDGAVPDDALLEAFWPDAPADAARRSLRVAVSCARAVLDAPGGQSVIQVAERSLGLRLRERDSVDVDRFEDAARVALAAPEAERRPLLERAVAVWTGEPLPEERYAEWTFAWREQLVGRYAEVLAGLLAACELDGDAAAGTQTARRLVDLEPLNEASQRALMRAYARSGRRAHALRQYLECRRTLIDELGVEPARETTDLQQQILAGEHV